MIVETQQFAYDGPIYHFKNKRYVDLMVTPNHRFLTMDRRKGKIATFRTAEEVYGLTNQSIPKTTGGIELRGAEMVSMLPSGRAVHANVFIYSDGRRLVNWFRTLPAPLQAKVRKYGVARKPALKGVR